MEKLKSGDVKPEEVKPEEVKPEEIEVTLSSLFTDSCRALLGDYVIRQQKTVKSMEERGGVTHSLIWPQPGLADRLSA